MLVSFIVRIEYMRVKNPVGLEVEVRAATGGGPGGAL